MNNYQWSSSKCLSIAHTSTSRFLGGNKVHFHGNNAHGEGISNANEELPGRWTEIGLIKAKDHGSC